MPQAIPVIVGIIVGAGTKSALIAAIAVAVASMAVSFATREKSADSSPEQGSLGLKVNTRSTQEPLKVVYGKQRIGCNDVYINVGSPWVPNPENYYLWVVSTLAEGECNRIALNDAGTDDVWLADQSESFYGAYLDYYFHSGSPTQTVDAPLATAFPEWTDCLRNTCYIVWRLAWNENLFQGFPARFVTLEGKKVYDFRDGPQPCDRQVGNEWNSEQWGTMPVYSANPVLCLYDWMTNDRYGMGISYKRFDIRRACASSW